MQKTGRRGKGEVFFVCAKLEKDTCVAVIQRCSVLSSLRLTSSCLLSAWDSFGFLCFFLSFSPLHRKLGQLHFKMTLQFSSGAWEKSGDICLSTFRYGAQFLQVLQFPSLSSLRVMILHFRNGVSMLTNRFPFSKKIEFEAFRGRRRRRRKEEATKVGFLLLLPLLFCFSPGRDHQYTNRE